jgi:hypothetical protein
MSARVLPPEEWSRLGEERAAFYSSVNPEDVRVVVVEDEGEIVATMAVMRMTHWECYWQAPETAGNAGITRALLRGAAAEAEKFAPHWYLANSDSEEMNDTLRRLGGEFLPVHTYRFRVDGVEV